MISDTTFEPVTARSKLRLRFSLLALFIFVTLVCLLLAWWVQPNRVVATSLFRVDSAAPVLLSDEVAQQRNGRDFEIVKKTQIALLKSHVVLNAAIRKPSIAALPILQSQTDAVEWLQDHLETDFPQNGEILVISLRGTEAQANDLVQLVDAVAKAYMDEVIYKDKQRRLAARDLLARSLQNLNQEIKRKTEEYLDISRETGALDSGTGQILRQLNIKRLDRIETELMRLENEQLQLETSGEPGNPEFFEQRIAQLRERQAELEKKITSHGEKSVELTTRERELGQLQRVADEMTLKLERLEIESQAPQRIELIQPAIVGRAD